MSYNNREVQPEFFCGIKKKDGIFNSNLLRERFTSSVLISIDTFIVIIITSIMVLLTSFVLGIERGKILANAEKTASVVTVTPKNTILLTPKNEEKNISIPEQTAITVQKGNFKKEETVKTPKAPSSGYSIQLATYSNDNFANNEIKHLKANGFSSFVVKSGKYYVVYSEIYDSKSTAAKNVDNFKKRYKDCVVRFLKNS